MATAKYKVINFINCVAVIALAVFSCDIIASDEEIDFNRDKFGRSSLPLWTELTPFEENTLRQIPQAQAGNAEALLALYILAAGSHREQSAFTQLDQQLDQWLAGMQKPLKRLRKDVQRAKFVHERMHQDFFLNDDEGSSLVGYDADQSQLPEIFTSQKFNCISSSLLYLVLARKLNLPVAAVLLPSHTFVQLNTDKNSPIEIETTSIYGFDTEHNEDFYRHDDLSWFEARNLEPATYQDYLQRRILTAYELGLHNMWSQHTQPERMAYRDRVRLAEIRGYLQPNDVNAQKNRLNFYLQELGYLNRGKDYAAASRLSNLIESYVNGLASMTRLDEVLKSLWIGLQTEIALAKIYADEAEKGLQLTKKLIGELAGQNQAAEQLQHNLYVVVSHYVLQNLKRPDFTRLRLSLMGLEQDCIANPACSHSFGQLYAAWAQQFWDQKDWGGASRILTEYLQFNIQDQNHKVFQRNAEIAYVNQAKEILWDGDWKEALKQLQICVDNLPEQNRCNEQIRYINEQRHLGNL